MKLTIFVSFRHDTAGNFRCKRRVICQYTDFKQETFSAALAWQLRVEGRGGFALSIKEQINEAAKDAARRFYAD